MPKKNALKKNATGGKSSPKKALSPKKSPVKKATAKKAPPKKAASPLPLADAAPPMNVSMRFLMGGGDVMMTHSSGGVQVTKKPLKKTGTVTFDDVKKKDVITVNGTCADSAELSTDRITSPASDVASPIKYTKNISQILRVR